MRLAAVNTTANFATRATPWNTWPLMAFRVVFALLFLAPLIFCQLGLGILVGHDTTPSQPLMRNIRSTISTARALLLAHTLGWFVLPVLYVTVSANGESARGCVTWLRYPVPLHPKQTPRSYFPVPSHRVHWQVYFIMSVTPCVCCFDVFIIRNICALVNYID